MKLDGVCERVRETERERERERQDVDWMDGGRKNELTRLLFEVRATHL